MDRFNVSDKFYHELSMVQPTIPHRIKRVRSELNQSLKTKMYRVPGPNHGIYCSLTERLSEELEVIIQLDPDSSHEVFKINLSGDGAKFSRCSNFFLVSFAILNLEQRVLSPRDELHWFLRVMAALLENVILQVVQLDVKVNKKRADPLQGAMLQKLVESIQACGVPFQIWRKDSGSSALDWTSLGGAGMRKVLSKLPAYLKDILPQDYSECITQNGSWTPDSDVIESKVKYPINKLQQCLQLHYLSIKAKQWINDFVALSPVAQGYQKDRVTPYMHIMAMQVAWQYKTIQLPRVET
eukprot:Em0012g391a